MKTATAILGYVILTGFYQLPEYVLNQTGNISAFLGLMALFVVVTHGWMRLQGEPGLSALGLGITPLSGMQLLAGLILQSTVTGVAFEVSCGLGITRLLTIPSCTQVVSQGFLFVIGTFLPSLAEDILTRGYVYHYWGKRLPSRNFVLISTILYVLNHIYRLQNGPTTWLFLTVVGISLAIPLVQTRSLWLTLGLHWGNNILYRLTNDVLQADDLPGFSSTWVLIGLICLLILLLPRLIGSLKLILPPDFRSYSNW